MSFFCILVLSSPADQESEVPSSATGSTSGNPEYAYNRKGQLVVNNYPFLRSGIKGAVNTSIEWRCADGRKYKCNARVRTLGKTLQVLNVVHNHEPRKQKQFNAIVWNENAWTNKHLNFNFGTEINQFQAISEAFFTYYFVI